MPKQPRLLWCSWLYTASSLDQHPAHRLVAPQRDELRGVAVFVEGVLAAVEELLDFDQQRRDPVRVFGIDPPRQFDEPIEIAAAADLADFKRGERREGRGERARLGDQGER